MDRVRRAAAEGLLRAVLLLSLPGPLALAHDDDPAAYETEAAAAYYADDLLDAAILSVRGGATTRGLWEGEGHATGARLGYTGKKLKFKEPANLLAEQLDGETAIEEHAVTASVDQGLQVGTTLGVLGGTSKSPLSQARFFGARVGQWWLGETLQTNVDVRKTMISQPPLEYTDTDGKRVVTPADLDGLNFGLTVTNLTTPTTILRSSYSRTTRTDRPPAWSLGGEVRQFITATSSAVHVAIAHYENVGHIEPHTSFGSIVADSVKTEWHQRLPGQLILMGSYRYYLEREKPRAFDAARKQVGTDAVSASLRWRPGDAQWTDESSELYAFVARYTTNAPNTAHLVGVGGRYLFR